MWAFSIFRHGLQKVGALAWSSQAILWINVCWESEFVGNLRNKINQQGAASVRKKMSKICNSMTSEPP